MTRGMGWGWVVVVMVGVSGCVAGVCMGQEVVGARAGVGEVGVPVLHSEGLHGYIGFRASRPPEKSEFSAGMGFYSAVWPLLDEPVANLQIGLASAWILPDNSDNKDRPLAPKGTLARTWPERGPTWDSVFQTIEGGLGYWARNHFRYGLPKFSMNATPQCYDYEVGSPGWSFFYSNTALPDHQLGIAQLSNRLLIPPDGLPFAVGVKAGRVGVEEWRGKFLGYSWMALPMTEAQEGGGGAPTGDQSWTCFLNAANFKGPIAFYIPETWSKIGTLFNEPFLFGRGLDARPATMGGGAMEINTVPRYDSKDRSGVVFSKIPRLGFPVDERGRAVLVQGVTYYSKAALYDAVKAWRDGGAASNGRFDEKGAWASALAREQTTYTQDGKRIEGVDAVIDNAVFEGTMWGVVWKGAVGGADGDGGGGRFPQYFMEEGGKRVVVPAERVPAETGLLNQEFPQAPKGEAYTSPGPGGGGMGGGVVGRVGAAAGDVGAWMVPGAKSAPLTVRLADGSEVTYAWYRFVDQPSFQQYRWSADRKAKLQALVEKMHGAWTIDGEYMPGPQSGELVGLDPALLVTPPKGMEAGYVPIVTGQTRR